MSDVVVLGVVSVCGVDIGSNIGCNVSEESVKGVCNGERVSNE